MELDNILKEKLQTFSLDNEEMEKSMIHYKSVLNVSNCLIKYNDDNAKYLKKKLIDYMDLIKKTECNDLDDLESLKLFRDYILPSAKYLYNKEKFVYHAQLFITTIMGFVIDLCIYYFITDFFIPIFTLSTYFIALDKRKQAKIRKKYAGKYY